VQLVVGKNGWFYRYEIYALFAAIACALFLGRAHLAGPLTPRLGFRVYLIVAALGFPYLLGTGQAAGAANNIYEQQYQMHRFVSQFYKQPVAVNDLGWVAYRNDQYVLDLWGLGSEQARAIHQKLPDPAAKRAHVEALVNAKDVRLAILYENRLSDLIPGSWRPLARMHLGHARISAGGSTVTFFATELAEATEIACQLAAFAKTLPPSVGFEQVVGCASER
jgi:hypothetical protein